jgi:ABC-type phosphate transport system substrate-binding protein
MLGGLLVAAAAVATASGGSAQTTSTTAPPGGSGSSSGGSGVTLNGEGSSGPFKEVTTWQNDLAGAQSAINLQYTANGSQQGRDDLIAGTSDYAISGTQFNGGTGPGFTSDEINQLPHKSLSDIIAAPVQVSALTFILGEPLNTSTAGAPPYGFDRQDQFCDPNVPPCDPNQPFNTPYTPAPQVPHANLAAMMLNYNGKDTSKNDTWGSNLSSWDAYDVLNAFGIAPPNCDQSQVVVHCLAGVSSNTHPLSVVQTQPDELDYYLQDYIRTAAPSVWAGNRTASPNSIKWEDCSPQPTCSGDLFERIPRVPNISRQGADQAGDQLGLPGGTAGGTPGAGVAGAIGALPPSSLLSAQQSALANGTPLEFISVQNKDGNWVQPSTASITAAVKAGNGTPLYALTHSTDGANAANAYPLTWVNYLYVKSSGLSAEKTEAAATLIRYLATDGQAAAAPWGEGTLSSPLVSQALNSANQVVQSNCPSAHGTIVKNPDPGPDAPGLPGMKAIGPMLHCIPPPAPSAPTASSAGADNPAGLSLPGLPTVPATPVTPAGPTAPAKAAAAATTLPDALTTAKLPLPLPGTPLDRFATLVLGALGYLLLRNPIRRRLGGATE